MTDRAFFVGVAKCGTSSLFDLLASHPDVCAPSVKEPHFHAFGGDRPTYTGPGDWHFNESVVVSQSHYDSLFGDARGRLRIDGSALTFAVPGGLERVRDAHPDAQCVLLVRDPRRRALSAWMHLTRDGRETLSLSEGLQREPARLAAGFAPIWGYHRLSLYRRTVDNARRVFGDRVHLLDVDSALRPPWDDLKALIEQLGLDAGGEWLSSAITENSRSNAGGLPALPGLYRRLAAPSRVRDRAVRVLPRPVAGALRRAKQGMLRPIDATSIDAVPPIHAGLRPTDFVVGRPPTWLG